MCVSVSLITVRKSLWHQSIACLHSMKEVKDRENTCKRISICEMMNRGILLSLSYAGNIDGLRGGQAMKAMGE